MNNEAMKEVLNELFSHLERLETQSEAILHFLKEKKRVTDKQLAPYLEQAGNASNVKWRAARVRINHLLEPEHPEEEIKLGKKPELQQDSSSTRPSGAASVADEGTESSDKDAKQTEPGDKAKFPSTSGIQGPPADGRTDKPEVKSESKQGNQEETAPVKGDKKSDSADVRHPTELTAPLARQEGPEAATELSSKEKNGDQEAA